MPSATLYSLPAQLGRRGATAVVVIALHVVMAIGLITAMAIRVTVTHPDALTVIPVVENRHLGRPTVHTSDGDWRERLPPVSLVPLDPDVVVPPSIPIQGETVPQPTAVADPGLVSQVRVLRDLEPLYPAAERRLQHEGVVTLRVRVGPTGRAEQVEIERSSGHARLDSAALEAVRQWIFAPAQNATGPVFSWVTLTVRFQLTG